LSEYYEKHFELQDVIDNASGAEWTMYVKTAEPYVQPPHYVDTDMAISKLKNGKTTGHDQNWLKREANSSRWLFINSFNP